MGARYAAGVSFHGVVQLVNFRFVPSNQRILYDNGVSLIWKAALSFMANNDWRKLTASKDEKDKDGSS